MSFLYRLLLCKSSHEFHQICTRTRFKNNGSFAQEFALNLCNKPAAGYFFKSFFLILILLLFFNATETVSSFSVRNGCFLSAVTFVIVNHLRDLLSEIPAFHNDEVTLHGLGDVSDWFSLTREKL